MIHYIDISHIQSRIEPETLELLTKDTIDHGIDVDLIEDVLCETTSMMDSYLQEAKYDIDKLKSKFIPMLRNIEFSLFIYNLYQRKSRDRRVLDILLLNYENVIKQLSEIRDGKMKLYGYTLTPSYVSNAKYASKETSKYNSRWR